jgi:hypothetical protein
MHFHVYSDQLFGHAILYTDLRLPADEIILFPDTDLCMRFTENSRTRLVCGYELQKRVRLTPITVCHDGGRHTTCRCIPMLV